ncbi:N-acetylmuramoyl-L-alanine amidase-like domain-containing protein [Persicitalea sp.]|uniref:N-acetylmuramoyl-L-alanine amidase-like domain-containing protein n=1 Tax=Persicitalea sp. TaxID=3100273 RepID=UPI003593F717
MEKIAKVSSGTLPELTLCMAETFMGIPYVAHTLEGNANEQLVCRFDALDCTTLVDVSVALALAKKEDLTYEQFLSIMTQLRYMGGVIDGYPSRQHYFLSWRNQGVASGLLNDVTEGLGGISYDKQINFMSGHADLYKGIDSETALNKIKDNEQAVNAEEYKYIPKTSVRNIESKLQDGDIIGITSTIAGLDCNHQGIVKMQKGRAYLVHASTTAKKVIESPEPLADYLNSVKRHSGIIVLRLNG